MTLYTESEARHAAAMHDAVQGAAGLGQLLASGGIFPRITCCTMFFVVAVIVSFFIINDGTQLTAAILFLSLLGCCATLPGCIRLQAETNWKERMRWICTILAGLAAALCALVIVVKYDSLYEERTFWHVAGLIGMLIILACNACICLQAFYYTIRYWGSLAEVTQKQFSVMLNTHNRIQSNKTELVFRKV